MEEMWKPIKGYGGLYEVSNFGQVRSLNARKGRILKIHVNKYGYCSINLYKNSEYKMGRIHRLVAMAFIPNPNNYPEINHKDGIKSNNHENNLEWVSRHQNIRHAFDNKFMNNDSHNIPVKAIKNNEVRFYKSSAEAGRILGIHRQNIGRCLKNKIKTAGGYKWEYQSSRCNNQTT